MVVLKRLWLALICLSLFIGNTAFGQNKTLPSEFRIGIIPNVSTTVLMANYAPLKDFLQDQGLSKVTLLTADNFIAFNQKTAAGDFDLIVTAPHMARLAQQDYKYTPIAAATPNIRALLITAFASELTASQINAKSIAYANPQSLVAMIGTKWLTNRGLTAGSEYKSISVPLEDNIGRMVADGDAHFGILSNGELRAVPERFQARLRIVEAIAEIPNFIFLANPRMSAVQLEELKLLIQNFSEANSHSNQFFKLTGYSALRPTSEPQLKLLDAYVDQTRKALATAPLTFNAAGSISAPSPNAIRAQTRNPVKSLQSGRAMNLDIQFFFNSDEIRPESKASLTDLIDFLQSKNMQQEKFIVEGHTDSHGSDVVNKKLSALRARSVRDYLISNGVSSTRLSAVGKGSSEPLIAANPLSRKNRRVSIVKVSSGL